MESSSSGPATAAALTDDLSTSSKVAAGTNIKTPVKEGTRANPAYGSSMAKEEENGSKLQQSQAIAPSTEARLQDPVPSSNGDRFSGTTGTTFAEIAAKGEPGAGSLASTAESNNKNNNNSISANHESVAASALFPSKPEPLQGRIMSASEVALASKPKSVTPARKLQLLEQARASRLEWIRKVPFPYLVQKPNNNNNNSSSSLEELDPLAPLRETHAGRQMPAALNVLQHLYGYPERADTSTVQQHIASILSDVNNHVLNAVPTPEQARKMALEEDSNNYHHHHYLNKKDKILLSAYHVFLQKLSDPAASVLVQWIRTFCRNLLHGNQQQQQQQQQSEQKQPNDDERKAALSRTIQSYATSTLEAIQSHALWKDPSSGGGSASINSSSSTSESTEMTRRSFESFLFGQCRDYIDSVLYTPDVQRKEQEWHERMDALQFVTATHLEVACLQEYEPSVLQQSILKEPVQALRSVSLYHAPYEKLQRILAMYHSINAALSRALNQNNDNTLEENDKKTTKKKKLPSADDVLPTIILTVLQARPDRLLYNLQLIEDFCPPEQLRGEAGYAFTNLYGAIQFLSDLNIDVVETNDKKNGETTQQQPPPPPGNLSISAEEFRQGLATCRAAAKERLAKQRQQKEISQSTFDSNAPSAAMAPFLKLLSPITSNNAAEISARDICVARARGETIDVDWALRRLRRSRHDDMTAALDEGEGSTEALLLEEQQRAEFSALTGNTGIVRETSASSGPLPTAASNNTSLPLGFRRSYTFLSLKPENVKVTDLPKLLEEYRMMVHATEELLAERQAKLSSEKKEQMTKDEKDLYERVKVVDPSLLGSDLKQQQQQQRHYSNKKSAEPTTNNKKTN
ncbi:hypothetical protein ACA910_018627 [Epithemia clementina (nom. ined.)]